MRRAIPPKATAISLPACCLLILCAFPMLPARADEMTLDYLYRYDHQPGGPDHLMDVIEISGARAIVSGNLGLTLIDLDGLPPRGTTDYLFQLTGLNARDVYLKDEHYLYVNLHRMGSDLSAGFAVVRINANVLDLIRTVTEPGVLYEKMCIDGDYLFVAAHRYGLRIFSLSDPAAPELVGDLTEGLVDAFAIAIAGDTAFIADGAGGLKVVDVTDKANPFLIAGESLEDAAGTSEDATWRDGRVYVAAGGAGLAVYAGGDPAQRTLVPVGGCAEALCWVGDHLAVGTLAGVQVLDVTAADQPMIVAGETVARRGQTATLRICSDVGPASAGRLLCANWNYMDVYQLVPADQSTQPDITPSVQRIRFPPSGGVQQVTLRNDGATVLNVTGVSTVPASFTTGYTGGFLLPGESVSFDVAYNGAPQQGSGMVWFHSDDPDEQPLPIQLFGNTEHLDPGEPAIDFTLPLVTRDHQTGIFTEVPFTLSDHLGEVVWFHVFATW